MQYLDFHFSWKKIVVCDFITNRVYFQSSANVIPAFRPDEEEEGPPGKHTKLEYSKGKLVYKIHILTPAALQEQ